MSSQILLFTLSPLAAFRHDGCRAVDCRAARRDADGFLCLSSGADGRRDKFWRCRTSRHIQEEVTRMHARHAPSDAPSRLATFIDEVCRYEGAHQLWREYSKRAGDNAARQRARHAAAKAGRSQEAMRRLHSPDMRRSRIGGTFHDY